MTFRMINSFLRSQSQYLAEEEPLSIKAINDNFMATQEWAKRISAAVESVQSELDDRGKTLLWSGRAAVGSVLTVPGYQDYAVLQVDPVSLGIPIIATMLQTGSTVFVRGIGATVTPALYVRTAAVFLQGTLNDQTLLVGALGAVSHRGEGTHTVYQEVDISSIWGIV
ncbi:MAG: hypothetical protein ACOYJC_05225 [Christensenellales bacterium]